MKSANSQAWKKLEDSSREEEWRQLTRTTLITNGLVVTLDGTRRILKDGAILVEGNRIERVGTSKDLRRFSADEVLNAEHGIVCPGFICAHSHLYGILLRGAPLKINPPTDFTQNLQRIWWPVDEALTLQDAYSSALAASVALLRTGTTTVADTYSGPNSVNGALDYVARGIEEVGIRGIISFEATERHNREEGFRGVNESLRFIRQRKKGRVFGMVSLHASFTVTDELISYAVRQAEDLEAILTMHACEGLGETYHNLERYGMRTIERLDRVRALGPRTVLAHCVNVNDDELQLIAKTQSKVAHNPLSNQLNAVGVAPVPRMLDLGITVGLGNDGYIFDVFENMRAAYLIHRIPQHDPRTTSAEKTVELATVNAAECYGLTDLGSLAAGKRADIVIMKPRLLPTPLDQRTVYSHLVNTISGCDVDTVLVDGEVVLRNEMPTRVRVADVNKVAQRSAENLWKRLRRVGQQVDVVRRAKGSPIGD